MWTILTHELKYYFKNKQEAIYLYSYFISILVLIPFAGDSEASKIQSLATMGLWIALASAVSMAGANLFRRDSDQGRLEYYQLLPIGLEAIMVAKWLAFFFFISIPLLLAIPLAGLLYNIPNPMLGRYVVGLLAGALGLSILSTLVAALTNGLEKAGAVLSLILLPLSIPVLIFGAQYCIDNTSDSVANLLFLLGFAVFMAPVMCLAGAYSIRASN
jgi:heme exporter protein B